MRSGSSFPEFERRFARECDRYVETAAASALHIQQSSADNLKRRVDTVSKSGTFVWCSADTKSTGRGSLMVYVINSTGEDGWYVEFVRTGDAWRMTKPKRTDDREEASAAN